MKPAVRAISLSQPKFANARGVRYKTWSKCPSLETKAAECSIQLFPFTTRRHCRCRDAIYRLAIKQILIHCRLGRCLRGLQYLLFTIQPARCHSTLLGEISVHDLLLPILDGLFCVFCVLLEMLLESFTRVYDVIWMCGMTRRGSDIFGLLLPILGHDRGRE